MRIIAGEFRGRTLLAPKGDGTRPTTDRVRESVMSTVFSARGGFEDAMVLDAFAGSGALGLEALSRGAARAVFYVRAPEAVKVLQKNVEKMGLEPRRATVTRADVLERAPQFSRPPFDLVFLDPPYAYAAADVLGMVAGLVERGVAAPDALVVYEHALASNDEAAAAAAECGFELASRKKYGDTTVDVLCASACAD